MADPTQIVLLPSEEAAQAATPLFPGSYCVYSNGRLAPQCLDYDDAVVIGPDAAWREETCTQLAKLEYSRIRFADGDISQIEGDPLEWVRSRIKPYSGPQVAIPSVAAGGKVADNEDSTDGYPFPSPDTPAVSESSQNALGSDWSDANLTIDRDEDERAEIALHSIRMASAIKSQAHAAPWPPLDDQFSDEIVLPRWNFDWMPQAFAPFCRDQSEIGGWDAGMQAMLMLCLAAGITTDEITLRVKVAQDWTESCRLWGLYYGGKSIGKTPAMTSTFKHATKIDFDAQQQYIHDVARYAKQMKIYEEQERAWVKAQAKGELGVIEPHPPEKPVDPQIVYMDWTVAALTDALQGNRRGVLGVLDELASLFERLDAYTGGRGSERQDTLRLFNGGRHIVNRIGRGKVSIDNWSASLVGGIQDDALAALVPKLNLASDGMLQRFIPYWAGRKNPGHERAENSAARQQFERTLENLHRLKPHFEPVRFSPDAQALRSEVDAWINAAGDAYGVPGPMVPFIDKLYGYYPRLCLTYWAIECAAEGREAIGAELPLSIAQQVFRYLRECVLPHAYAFYGKAIGAEGGRLNGIRQICTWIVCRPELTRTVTLRNFQTNCREAWSPEGTPAFRENARRELLVELIGSGWIRPTGPADKVGKLPSEFEVNPEVDKTYAAMREIEIPKRRARYEDMENRKRAKRAAQAQTREPGED